jgi:hypothetical protein
MPRLKRLSAPASIKSQITIFALTTRRHHPRRQFVPGTKSRLVPRFPSILQGVPTLGLVNPSTRDAVEQLRLSAIGTKRQTRHHNNLFANDPKRTSAALNSHKAVYSEQTLTRGIALTVLLAMEGMRHAVVTL